MAVQDPSYPVYVDTSVIMGMTGDFNEQNSNYSNIQYMPCTPDNGFFPDLSAVNPLSLYPCQPAIYCSVHSYRISTFTQ